jgi:hypothetical protein
VDGSQIAVDDSQNSSGRQTDGSQMAVRWQSE